MDMLCSVNPAPVLAGNILRSIHLGDTVALDSALERVEREAPTYDEDERLELVGAIAAEIRASARRRRDTGSDDLGAFLPLLRNLAGY